MGHSSAVSYARILSPERRQRLPGMGLRQFLCLWLKDQAIVGIHLESLRIHYSSDMAA